MPASPGRIFRLQLYIRLKAWDALVPAISLAPLSLAVNVAAQHHNAHTAQLSWTLEDIEIQVANVALWGGRKGSGSGQWVTDAACQHTTPHNLAQTEHTSKPASQGCSG